ncbi:hypothetical protein HDK64DRAFT_73782 [Phyllosticta capitalensis]
MSLPILLGVLMLFSRASEDPELWALDLLSGNLWATQRLVLRREIAGLYHRRSKEKRSEEHELVLKIAGPWRLPLDFAVYGVNRRGKHYLDPAWCFLPMKREGTASRRHSRSIVGNRLSISGL